MATKMSPELRSKLIKSSYNTLIENSFLSDFIIDNDRTLYPDDIDRESFIRLKEIMNGIYHRVMSDDAKKNLLICSNHTGNGKTSWAIKILKEYFRQDSEKEYHPYPEDYHIGIFIPTTEFVLDSKEYNDKRRQHYWTRKEAIDSASLVVFDDIGSAEYSRSEYVVLLSVIDKMIFENRMCIFTSNFTEKNSASITRLGQRLADRIFDTSEIIELKGQGMRN